MINRNSFGHSLSNLEIERYSRQLILNDFGVEGQEKLKKSSVLIVGAGGLGCPVAMYLTAAGVAHLGVVDYDSVELNNLHRQVAHSEKNVKLSKAESLRNFCINLNSNITVTAYDLQLNNSNALEIIRQYDVVCDCSDNVPTRYLLNDACVLGKKPLVSGSALRWEGQLTVYGYKRGPCYRCIFPTPPPPETVVGCSEGGVVGVVPGIIGNMQALEVLKILIGIGPSFNNKLLLFDGLSGQFRTVNLRSRNIQCAVCSDNPKISRLIDYEQMCGTGACDKVLGVKKLSADCRITVEKFNEKLKTKEPFLLIDCRPQHEYGICHLKPSLCLPLQRIIGGEPESLIDLIKNSTQTEYAKSDVKEIIVICHRGNDSQDAVLKFQQLLPNFSVRDVEGGFEQWALKIDKSFPRY